MLNLEDSANFDERLEDLRRRLEGASPSPWTVAEDPDGTAFIRTGRDRGEVRLFVRRNLNLASTGDIEFITLARNVLPRLLEAVVSGRTDLVSSAELDEYAAAANRATPGPWTPFIEDKQPIGGCSVIWAGGENDPDMYLWLGKEIAPAGDIEFVAHARTDVPELVAELRRRRASDQP